MLKLLNPYLTRKLSRRRWNKTIWTEDDFYKFCDEDGITVFEVEINAPGLTVVAWDQIAIFISKKLKNPKRHFVLFHELAHAWLHVPGIQFCKPHKWKTETEANIIAACALIPRSLVSTKSAWELWDEYSYSPVVIELRQKIFKEQGF